MKMTKVTEKYKYELLGSKKSNGPVLIISKRSKSVFEKDKIERVVSGSMAEEIFSWLDDELLINLL